jgi:hypothetical protein
MVTKGGKISSGAKYKAGSKVKVGKKEQLGKSDSRQLSYWELQVETMTQKQLRKKAKELGLKTGGSKKQLQNRIKKDLKKDQRIDENAVLSVDDQGSITAVHYQEPGFQVDIIDQDIEPHKDASVDRLDQGMYAINQESGLGGQESLLVTVSDNPLDETINNNYNNEKRKETSDPDQRGFRGNQAENEVIDVHASEGWQLVERPSRGHDLVFKKGSQEKYFDVKEIDETVDSGKSLEKGRVQIDKQELARIKNWEKESPSREAGFIIKINRDDGQEEWKQLSLTKADQLMKGKVDPVKIPFSELEKLPDYLINTSGSSSLTITQQAKARAASKKKRKKRGYVPPAKIDKVTVDNPLVSEATVSQSKSVIDEAEAWERNAKGQQIFKAEGMEGLKKRNKLSKTIKVEKTITRGKNKGQVKIERKKNPERVPDSWIKQKQQYDRLQEQERILAEYRKQQKIPLFIPIKSGMKSRASNDLIDLKELDDLPKVDVVAEKPPKGVKSVSLGGQNLQAAIDQNMHFKGLYFQDGSQKKPLPHFAHYDKIIADNDETGHYSAYMVNYYMLDDPLAENVDFGKGKLEAANEEKAMSFFAKQIINSSAYRRNLAVNDIIEKDMDASLTYRNFQNRS